VAGRSLAATALTIGVCVLAAGCGTSAAPGDPGTVAPTTRPPAAQAKCVPARGRTVSIGIADNGKSFCVPAGTGVYVFLHGTAAHLWTAIRPSSTALQPRPSGVMSLTAGTTAGYFVTVRPGVATLTSARVRPCTGTCAAQGFRVTLVIGSSA
jgi:hypothetical protein